MQRILPRHFSMLRDFHLADFFTLGNAACGVGAVLFAMLYMQSQLPFDFFAAAALAPAAFIFDVFDGKIARARHQHSALGRELDSLADIVSFGVAPAALGFAAGLQGGWDAAALIYFVCCGVSRLARYNVTAETLDADAALAAGLISRKVEPAAIEAAVAALTARLLSFRPEAVAAVKQFLGTAPRHNEAHAALYGASVLANVLASK